ncbi:hypothetical protein Ate02nite_84140 [Paractinoplanes tereljensis]|uniref:O-glycosyl hydrolase n=1 Tax=Paractinoplanes tereljensis TaxID=571912 RepID=A0A919TXZ7_9ACTN|nr:hypothetical protein Ate02nite_84140 [Actinoplanes tereljensis]
MIAAATLVTAFTSAPASAAEVAAGKDVSVHIDPSYQQPAFEGWGTSLVWFANATGGYPEPIRQKLVDLVFGADGLNLNIARYNIGGGNAPDVRTDYMKTGATMPGFWQAPAGTTHTDTDWWDPDDPADWNLDADANQRWWVDQIKDRITKWEAFSNSPPYFQTVSGYVSGGFNSTTDQIRPDRLDDFATYLTRVATHLEQAHGIHFDTINPLNEPNTNYWGTTLGADGQPTGGRQEGAHASPALQSAVIQALRRATSTKISAPDETNPGIFMTDWAGYSPEARAAVDQLNVHTYGTGRRTSVRDAAKAAGKPLWMSEVEGDFGTGTTDYTGMGPGLGIAGRIIDDLRELEPSAWVLWQPIEDAIPQQAGGGNWGEIHIPFNCTPDATPSSCPIQTNTKFDTIRNFTHFIRPGDHMVKVNDPKTIAAVRPSSATVVHVNAGTEDEAVTLDLSGFAKFHPGARVTPIVSSAAGPLVKGTPIRISARSATLTAPAGSVTTFQIEGVSGVAHDAATIQPGHVYRLQGTASARSLTPTETGAVLRTTDPTSPTQLWKINPLTNPRSNRARYAVISAADDQRRLAVRGGALVTDGTAADGISAEWMVSTTGDGSWTLINVGTGGLVDVSGQATADGSPVGTYTPTSGANQRWTLIDETVLRTTPAVTYTVPGLAPVLPATVTPVYRDGARGSLPVTWTMPPASAWRHPGTVKVTGVATDPLGRRHPATAKVTVDTFIATTPARLTTYTSGSPTLPPTVTGIGRHGGKAALPVAWATPPAFDEVGTFTVTGTATVVDGSTLPATAIVTVVEPIEVNAALDEGVTMTATYTESGYSPVGLRNGDRTEKAWSNWRSGTKNPADTITATLPAERDLTRVSVYFYRDGTNASFPAGLRAQILATDGTWQDASTELTVNPEGPTQVDVPLTARTAAVRLVMTARPAGYITASEIEVYAKAVP